MEQFEGHTLSDFIRHVRSEYPFVMDPMPNLYFTRDPFASVGNGVTIHKMFSETRRRETVFADYIFSHHPLYKNTKIWYDREEDSSLEGGDILILNRTTVAIGISQRTHESAIEKFAENIRRLAKAMFAGAPYDDTLTMMENYIVLGPPVKDAAAAAIAASSSSSRAARILKSAFPPYKNMVQRYPVLKKIPILLPFLWIWRLLSYAFTKDERIRQKRERLKNENRKSTDTLQQIFEKSGL